MIVIITTSGINTSWSWSEFLFGWKGHSLLHCRTKEGLSRNILFQFCQCGLEIIICIWTISPISAGSDTKFKELVHSSFTRHTLIKPLPHSRNCAWPFTHSIPSSHNIEKNCYCGHFTGVKLRPVETELSTQEHTGIRAGAAQRGCSGNLHTLPPGPVSQGSQLLPDPHFGCCMGFNLVSLIGIKYFWLWKEILLTSGSCIE